VIATIIPITTNTTIATCIQIQVGDIRPSAYCARRARLRPLLARPCVRSGSRRRIAVA
jgi:hypothetical protein